MYMNGENCGHNGDKHRHCGKVEKIMVNVQLTRNAAVAVALLALRDDQGCPGSAVTWLSCGYGREHPPARAGATRHRQTLST